MTELQELVEKALKLPSAEREMLADTVLASLDKEQLGTVDLAWLEEAERRFERHVADAGRLYTSKELLEEIRRAH